MFSSLCSSYSLWILSNNGLRNLDISFEFFCHNLFWKWLADIRGVCVLAKFPFNRSFRMSVRLYTEKSWTDLLKFGTSEVYERLPSFHWDQVILRTTLREDLHAFLRAWEKSRSCFAHAQSLSRFRPIAKVRDMKFDYIRFRFLWQNGRLLLQVVSVSAVVVVVPLRWLLHKCEVLYSRGVSPSQS